MTRARALVIALAALLGLLVVPSGGSAATVPVTRVTGDLTMSDGTTLRYTVVRPANGGRLPTLFEYSGYDPGTNPDANYISQYVSNGAGYN